jgi:hypothetical protein
MQGSTHLRSAPFEYLLLRQQPRPWLAEDSLLVVLSMFITLQDYQGAYESTLGTMNDVLPQPVYDFLAPMGTEWDSPIIGDAIPVPADTGSRRSTISARVESIRPASPLGPRRTDDIRYQLPTSNSQLPKRDRVALLGVWRLDSGAFGELGVGNWELTAIAAKARDRCR